MRENAKKKTFWKLDGNGIKHLRFIISDIDPDGNILVVNMTTIPTEFKNNYYDKSCILNKGEHPKIKHKSYIKYSKAEEINFECLTKMNLKKIIVFKEDINNELLLKIQNGARSSKFLAKKFRKYFEYF